MDRRRVATRTLATGILIVSALAACRPAERTYPLRGQVLAVNVERGEIAVKHDDIPGLMPGMIMTFKVADPAVAKERAAGDLIEATLAMTDRDAVLRDVRKIGSSDLTPAVATAAASGFELIKEGDPVPDESFVDETGRTRRLADWRGRAVAITFIYTRCPIPTFCPMMDRHFAAVQKEVRGDPALASRVKLVSVSFDPAYDTPTVLRAHAAKVGAQPETWSFLTGPRDNVDRFASRFGVSLGRDTPEEITHNLRTAVVRPDGRLARVFTGNDWTPAQLLEALKAVAN
ncbi:MAG TPA: SCO family protein [Vicinamibacterales bacterium]|jgi:protein SCO1/2|nr:SCO family protein [Vicinamibacterales bacterium]